MPQEQALARSALPGKALALERAGAKLAGALAPVTAQVLEAHMRVINSYYSNLIEGHNTHPRDIARAAHGDYSEDPVKRDRQIEALALVTLQGELAQTQPKPLAELLSKDNLLALHRRFYGQLPQSLRIVRSSLGDEKEVVPGCFRQHDEQVNVGGHLAPQPREIETMLDRWREVYSEAPKCGSNAVIMAMAAHHRLLWIHPFLDGNGRVARLLTDQFLRSLGVGACGIWCLSRGLARSKEAYRAALARADFVRQGQTDGRGALSQRELIGFCEFLLDIALDQVRFMSDVLALEGMSGRIRVYVSDRARGLAEPGLPPLRPEAYRLLERAFMVGDVPRAQVTELTGLKEVTARRLVAQLKGEGLLSETSSRSPLRWAIPGHAERYYLPHLVG